MNPEQATRQTVRVRGIEPDDRSRVRDLHARSFPRELAFDELVLQRLFTHPSARNLVAEGPDGLVGYVCALHGTGPRARILTIHTAPDARRQGVARRLLEELVDRLRARQASRLELDVHVDNEPALELYRSLGFEILREDPTAYPSLDPSAGYVMSKKL